MAKKVVIYTTPTCAYCKATKEFFKENKIQYSEKNVAEDKDAAKEMIEKSGQMGVPVIDVDGKLVIGFDRNALKKALAI